MLAFLVIEVVCFYFYWEVSCLLSSGWETHSEKNENLTILPVGFGDTKSQSVEHKILSLLVGV